jgi:hypothetical protein
MVRLAAALLGALALAAGWAAAAEAAPTITSAIAGATSVSLPAGASQYYYVGSVEGGDPGNPGSNIGTTSWTQDLQATGAAWGTEVVSVGRSTSSTGSFDSQANNFATAGAGTSGYTVLATYSKANSIVGPGCGSCGPDPVPGATLSLNFTTEAGDTVLILLGGQGTGSLTLSGISATTLQNQTYSEAGGEVYASAAVYQASLPAGSYTASWTSTSSDNNSGSTLGAVAYVLRPGIKLSGTLSEQTCTPTACGQTGVSDAEVTVAGTAATGGAESQTATSDASGDWSVVVPAGTYAVTPEDSEGPWTPASLPSTSYASDASGLNFVRCSAADSGSASTDLIWTALRPLQSTTGPPLRCTSTRAFCSATNTDTPSQCQAIVADIAGGHKSFPMGSVLITAFNDGHPEDTVQFSCPLTVFKQYKSVCSFGVAPQAHETIVLAQYPGDANHALSSFISSFVATPPGTPPPQKPGKIFSGEDKQELLELKSGCDLAKIPWGMGALYSWAVPEPAVSKGTAAVLTTGAAAFSLCSWVSDFMRTVIDPPDRHYGVVAKPHIPHAPKLPGAHSKIGRAATDLAANSLAVEALAGVLVTTVDRATAAGRAGASTQLTEQLGAAAHYEKRISELLESDIALQRRLAGLLRKAGLGTLVLPAGSAGKIEHSLHGRLPSGMVSLLRHEGVTSSILADLRSSLLAHAPPKSAGLASALVTPHLLALERRIARALARAALNPAPAALGGAKLPVIIPAP